MRPGPSPASPAFWDSRARRAAAFVAAGGRRDPLVARVAAMAGRRGTVVDVGSGPGRLAIPLAARVGHVVAVDSSAAMLAELARRARREGVDNLTRVHGTWGAAGTGVGPAEVVVAAYVLPLVCRAGPFLSAMDGAATRRAVVVMNAVSTDLLVDPLWRRFHDRPRRPAPTYLDLVAMVAGLGRSAEVEVVETPVSVRFADLGAAVRSYREQLLVPPGRAHGAELRRLLGAWLVRRPDGLAPPVRTVPAAVVSWSPAGA